MPKQVKLRRGTTAQHATFTGAEGEVTVDTTKKCLVVHDGATAGGRPYDGAEFVKLDTGVEETTQTIMTGLEVIGADVNGVGLFVGSLCSLSDVQASGQITAAQFKASVIAVTYAASVALRFDTPNFQTLALTGDITFTMGAKITGVASALLVSAGAALRNLTWPSGVKWVGASPPATLAANKVGLLQGWCFGTTNADVVFRWLAEP